MGSPWMERCIEDLAQSHSCSLELGVPFALHRHHAAYLPSNYSIISKIQGTRSRLSNTSLLGKVVKNPAA